MFSLNAFLGFHKENAGGFTRRLIVVLGGVACVRVAGAGGSDEPTWGA